MKKTTFLPLLGLFILASLLTAFTVRKVFNASTEVSFQDFLKQFPREKLPFGSNEKDLRADLDSYAAFANGDEKAAYRTNFKKLDWKYYKFLPGLDEESRFSRMPATTEPVAMFSSGDHVGVLYTVGYGRRMIYRNYSVTVFTKDGQFVSHNKLGSLGTETAITYSVDRNLNLTLKNWTINWEKDYSVTGVNGNKVTGLTQSDEKVIDLNAPTPEPQFRFKKEMIAPMPVEEKAPPAPRTR